MKKLIPVAMLIFCTFSYAQKKHPKNPRIIIPENYTPEKWRVLSEQDKHIEAASELLYLVRSDTTRNQHADYWHIGQLYADANQYDKAIFYMTKAKETGTPDEQWLYYFKGTIAFLNRDRETLKKYTDLLEQNHTPYYASNAKALKLLLQNFEKPYHDVFNE